MATAHTTSDLLIMLRYSSGVRASSILSSSTSLPVVPYCWYDTAAPRVYAIAIPYTYPRYTYDTMCSGYTHPVMMCITLCGLSVFSGISARQCSTLVPYYQYC